MRQILSKFNLLWVFIFQLPIFFINHSITDFKSVVKILYFVFQNAYHALKKFNSFYI